MKDISIIAAVGKNWVIGKNGKMLWNIPEDLQNFRKLTMGNVIVMGRKTYQSIGKKLDGRENVILTRNLHYKPSDCIIAHSLNEVLTMYSGKCIYVIGGAEVFRQFLPIVNFLYITYIDYNFEGDTYFPAIDFGQWRLVYKRDGKFIKDIGYNYYFTKYKREI